MRFPREVVGIADEGVVFVERPVSEKRVRKAALKAVGQFVARLPVEWAWLVSVLYLVYQLLDWRLNGSNPVKDVATFLAGVVAGLGYDVVKY